jgi:hypothetical protein
LRPISQWVCNDDLVEGWHDFFVATAGAAAALAGLIIVAISVNIKAIIALPSVASRAAATVALLVLSLLTASAMLIPDQSRFLLGLEILAVAAAASIIVIRSAMKILQENYFRALRRWLMVALAVVQIVPFLVGAMYFLGGQDAGIGWVAAGILLVFAGSVSNAWVLLVEILR